MSNLESADFLPELHDLATQPHLRVAAAEYCASMMGVSLHDDSPVAAAVRSMSDTALVSAVVRSYPATEYRTPWQEFCFLNTPVEPMPLRELQPTPLRTLAQMKRANLPGLRQFRLQPHWAVETAEFRPETGTAYLVITLARVDERRSRDRITQTGLRLMTWLEVEPGIWELNTLDTWDEDTQHEFVRYGKIHDAATAATERWQLLNCYRPGTHNTPMAGPVAQAGMAHSEVFEGERYQTPPKTSTPQHPAYKPSRTTRNG
jgi:hypothetical protein